MSEVMIALLLLVPIFIVVIILNTVHRSSKKKIQAKIHQYITEVMRENAIVSHYHKQFIHQTVILDEKSRRLAVIDHKEEPFSFEAYHLSHIDSVQVVHQKLTVMEDDKGKKTDNITTNIGVELKSDKAEAAKMITLYDYVDHSIHQMPDFEKEAWHLKDRIEKSRN
jgi:hypothetical protein